MSYIGGSDAEQEKTEFRRNRSSNSLISKTIGSPKISDVWNDRLARRHDDSDSEISDSGNFLAKGM